MTAYSGTDGIHAYVNSLASTDPLKDVEIGLLARNNEVLAAKKTDAVGAVAVEPVGRGEGGLAPALLIASGDGGDYAFLDLAQSAFDLTDRASPGATCRRDSMPSCSPSAASIAPARRCM